MTTIMPCLFWVMMAIAFIPNPDIKPQVNHINSCKTDNNVCNLEWATRAENMSHSIEYGLAVRGQQHYNTKLNDSKVKQIKQLLKQGKTTLNEVASKFDIGVSTVHDVKSGKQWKHLKIG